MAATTKINGAEWNYDFKIRTELGEKVIGAHAINSFVIHDNYFDPWPTGELFVASPYNTMEDDIQLRGDGTDEIEVNISPKKGGGGKLQYNEQGLDSERKKRGRNPKSWDCRNL